MKILFFIMLRSVLCLAVILVNRRKPYIFHFQNQILSFNHFHSLWENYNQKNIKLITNNEYIQKFSITAELPVINHTKSQTRICFYHLPFSTPLCIIRNYFILVNTSHRNIWVFVLMIYKEIVALYLKDHTRVQSNTTHCPPFIQHF